MMKVYVQAENEDLLYKEKIKTIEQYFSLLDQTRHPENSKAGFSYSKFEGLTEADLPSATQLNGSEKYAAAAAPLQEEKK
jgi:hypothetical protein